ncbi:MAG TPA: hypothetical protein DCL24_04335 [Erysipelotrichaceae bacterium]|nr:hypothetical protein [Erysipelotrichaceae bacterium]
MNIDHQIVFACDNAEKELYKSTNKTNFVKESYFANYDINENQWYKDIRFIDGKEYRGKVGVLVGGTPCRSFSTVDF